MVAIPTGILSAGFVEHYTWIKTMNEASEESDIRFVQLRVGLRVSELDISRKTMIVMIRRGDKMLIPNGSTILRRGDVLLLYTKKNIRDAMDVEVWWREKI